MKPMRVFFISMIATCLFSCQPKELPTMVIDKDEMFVAKFSHMTTKAEMENTVKLVEQKGGTLDISRCKFFDSGKLQILNITVKEPSGNAGSTKADIVPLQYGYYGFEWQSDGQFGVGSIN
jgi:hypothetical protein